MEIQRLILIDFTALNGGIKKGSIDAILLSIEMIEKGFRSNRISKRETHTGLPPLNQILILKGAGAFHSAGQSKEGQVGFGTSEHPIFMKLLPNNLWH